MSKPIFQLIAKDCSGDRESWSWMAVLHFTGDLERDPEGGDTISEEQVEDIYRFLAAYDIHVRPAGNGTPGGPYANEAWEQWYPHHIIITQTGGLDV